MFARASKEIDAKRKFDATHTRVEEDGAIVGTCAGSNPGDAYDVRVRVRGKKKDEIIARSSRRRDDAANSDDIRCSVVNTQENQETHEEAPLLVEVSCTCPAARAQAFRGDARETRFGARPAAPPRAQPPRSCKHSTALLLWRARTLAAVADPDASLLETGGGLETTDVSVDEARRETHERTTTTRELSERPARSAPARRSAPPPRPAVPPAKKRRLPPSLAQSAAAAAEAERAGRFKRPSRPSREDPAAVRERGKGNGEKETPASRAPSSGAAPVAVKREPGLGDAAAAGDAGENAPAPGTKTSPGISLSRDHLREVVAKAQTIGDAALLDAARRAMRGDAEGAAEGAAEASASRAARDDALSAARGAPEPRAPSPQSQKSAAIFPPPQSQKSAAPAMKDMFASLLPAAFKAPTGAAANAPAPAPAGDSSLGDSSLENTRPAGTARPVSIAEPAVLPAVAPSAGGAVSTGAVGEAPAAEGAKGGPKKMSFAELMASGGL